MNRRKMLAFSLGTVAMTLTGCRKKRTVIVIRNRTGVPVSITATGNVQGQPVNLNVQNLPNKRTFRRVYVTNNARGNVQFSGTGTVGTQTGPFSVPVTLGKRNVFILTIKGGKLVITRR